jgi:hypothetical protein
MSIYVSTPVIFSSKVLEELQKELVLGKIANKEYEGELEYGSEIVLTGRGKPTISPYTGTVTWQNIQNAQITLRVDQQYYFAQTIEDIDKFQSNIDYMAGYAKDGAHGLELKVDDYIAGLYSQSGHAAVLDDDSVDVATAIGDITLMHTVLAENDVPENNMWICIPPWLADKLELAGLYHAQKVAGEVVNGFIGHILHFDVYVSNNLKYAGALADRDHYVMAGSYDSIAYVGQIKKTDIFDKLEDQMAGGVRMLHVWGAKVVKPKELIYATLKYAAETTI